MLVLNTTSPVASPGAPAAVPSNQVPSSSARMASTSVYFLQRPADPIGCPADNLDRGRPRSMLVELEPHAVVAGFHIGQHHRRSADGPAVQERRGAHGARVENEHPSVRRWLGAELRLGISLRRLIRARLRNEVRLRWWA